ncbi:multimerin-2 [Bombina bombina]|uniref:multimerin-2 n=1 Tax=Bombina bombina TaxID=8345 RepID=UPI00235B1CDC|nr:multimerin-2 [Bombina bombina]
MTRNLYVAFCYVGLIPVVSLSINQHSYDAGSSPVGSRLEVHGMSTYLNGFPGHGEDLEEKEAVNPGVPQTPNTRSSQNEDAIAEQANTRGKWCSFVKSQIVTYADLCKTEKYVIRSQQPCLHGTPDCQRIIYRHAHKPIYKLKRKQVTRLEWKCCPGYVGANCDEPDPNSIQIPIEQEASSEDSQEVQIQPEVSEIIQAIIKQKTLRDDIQNDIHQASSNLLDLQNVLENNDTLKSLENQTKGDIEDRLLREVFLPHVENFLKERFNPVWDSFNKSLQHLSNMVKNLSENVETNKKRMDTFLENTVPKKDLYELGAKFESKIQENIAKIDQVKHELDSHLHMQQAGIHYNLTMIKADTDMKLKRYQKTQQAQSTHLNNTLTELKAGQDKLQDEIQVIAENMTELWIHCGPRDGTNNITTHLINVTLADFKQQITDLYTESDAAFENISTLEKWVKELRTQTKTNEDEVQVKFMEKSLIMEEYKEFILRQVIGLNYTIHSIKENNDEVLKNCDCQKITLDILALEDKQRNFSNLVRDALYGVEEVKKTEGSSKTSLENSVEDLSVALQLNQQSLTAQQEQGRNLVKATNQLKSQVMNYSTDVEILKKENEQINKHIKYLDSSFSSLLEDAIRHERALEALLGEEVLEVVSDDKPEVLRMSVLQIYNVLNETLIRLERQQLTTDSIMDRMHFLELQPGDRDLIPSTIFNVEQQVEDMGYDNSFKQRTLDHIEPRHTELDETEYMDIMTLKNDIKLISEKVKNLESYLSGDNHSCNETIFNALKPLNISVGFIKSEMLSLREHFGDHVHFFKKIFGNYEALIASNVTLDIAKIQMIIDKKPNKKEKNGESQDRRRDKKQTEQLWQSDDTMRTAQKQDSPVAFSAGFSEGAEGVKILQFNEIYLNYGNVFSSEDGHFTVPYGGVYAFAISVDFGPGSALAHLVFGGRHKLSLYNNSVQQAESIKHQFAIVELQKDEKVWLELLHGSIKKNSFGTVLTGYLIFKT